MVQGDVLAQQSNVPPPNANCASLPFGTAVPDGVQQPVPSDEASFTRLLRSRFDSLTPFTRGHERVLMAGADVWEPEEALPVMVDKFNRTAQPYALHWLRGFHLHDFILPKAKSAGILSRLLV